MSLDSPNNSSRLEFQGKKRLQTFGTIENYEGKLVRIKLGNSPLITTAKIEISRWTSKQKDPPGDSQIMFTDPNNLERILWLSAPYEKSCRFQNNIAPCFAFVYTNGIEVYEY